LADEGRPSKAEQVQPACYVLQKVRLGALITAEGGTDGQSPETHSDSIISLWAGKRRR
jgi:hypothetical protein